MNFIIDFSQFFFYFRRRLLNKWTYSNVIMDKVTCNYIVRSIEGAWCVRHLVFSIIIWHSIHHLYSAKFVYFYWEYSICFSVFFDNRTLRDCIITINMDSSPISAKGKHKIQNICLWFNESRTIERVYVSFLYVNEILEL